MDARLPIKAIILAGGFGTRLSEETAVVPKPMIEIGGRPLLWHLMKLLSWRGIDDFVVALGYKGEVIKRYFLDYPQLGSDLHIDLSRGKVETREQYQEAWRVSLVDTGQETMTGGRLKRLAEHFRSTILFTYGDGLSDVDVAALLAFHRAHGRLATVTAVPQPQRFGVLDLAAGGRVTAFNEKPAASDAFINAGYFILEPGVLDYIDADASVWERDCCQRLARDGELMAWRHAGYWQCVDTLHELRQLRDTWNRGEAPWKVWP
jgi:glucose-1-phosphate cytidylyltransferase